MTKITLDDKEYDTANLTDEQNQIVNILNVGTNSVAMLDHMTQCVRAIQQMKTSEQHVWFLHLFIYFLFLGPANHLIAKHLNAALQFPGLAMAHTK